MKHLNKTISNGVILGMILFISSILVLSLNKDHVTFLALFPWLLPILAGYLLVGIIIQWFYSRPPKERHWPYNFGIYWFYIPLLAAIFFVVFPKSVRYIFLTNIILLLCLWIIDYTSLHRIAKELNGPVPRHSKVLIVDLDEKPSNKQEFFHLLEDYCIKNRISLEYIERNIPAIVKMNGVLHQVDQGMYYAIGGSLVYTLRIMEI